MANAQFAENIKELVAHGIAGALVGKPLKIAKGISNEELESVYSLAYSYYTTGKYEDALKLFKFLVMFDHMNQKYWVGLGSVYQVLKKWDDAIAAYANAMFFDISRPKPVYYAALCYYAKGDKVQAAASVQSFDLFCTGNDPETVKFRGKIAALKSAIGTEAFEELARLDKEMEEKEKKA